MCSPKCTSGYAGNEKKQIAKFLFSLKNAELNKQWVCFVNVLSTDWLVTKHSVLCEVHFGGKYLRRGEKCTLEWSMNPVPIVYPQKLLSKPSSLPTQQTTLSLPRKRSFPDELPTFQQLDMIRTFKDLNKSIAPAGFQFKELDNHVLYFHLVFDDETKFPKILESIKVDNDLHVQLQCNGMPLPLPQWFVQGHKATLKKVSCLENFPAYIRNTVTGNCNELLNKLNQKKIFNPLGRPPYSASMIQYALHLRCTSLQAYSLLLEISNAIFVMMR